MKWLGVAALGAVDRPGRARRPHGALLPAAPRSRPRTPGLAEIFFCLTVAIALFTSPGWMAGYAQRRLRADDDAVPRACAALGARPRRALIYAQILVGATMRHTGAGLAIPDFPLMFGHLVPDHWDAKIAVHFAHRVGALVVTLAVARDVGARLVSPPRPRAS